MQRLISSNLFKTTALLLVVLMSLVSVVPNVNAGFVPSKESMSTSMRQQDMAHVQQALENKMVAKRLQDLGYTSQEINARLAQLSDAEVHALATQLDNLAPAGGALGVVAAVLLIVVLVLLVLRLT